VGFNKPTAIPYSAYLKNEISTARPSYEEKKHESKSFALHMDDVDMETDIPSSVSDYEAKQKLDSFRRKMKSEL
jgi:hypothetical protein